MMIFPSEQSSIEIIKDFKWFFERDSQRDGEREKERERVLHNVHRFWNYKFVFEYCKKSICSQKKEGNNC